MAFWRSLTAAQKRAALRKDGSTIPAVNAFDAEAGNVVEQALVEMGAQLPTQAASVAADVATLRGEFNTLLANLKANGTMAP